MSWIKPLVFENSKIPVWLSYISPININALSIGPFVWCRGEISDTTRQHETIHFWQQIEMLFVLQWLLYGIFYVIGRFTHGNWKMAYYCNPFEVEAYEHQEDKNYLQNRKWWSWVRYIRELKG